MQYRKEIDGLRALAVVPVVLFHAGIPGFDGGFVGVDVFFVISGYLITTLLLEALQQGNFSLVTFYERRARRILPVLLLVVLACLLPAWWLLLPHELVDFGRSMVAVALFVSNVLFWQDSGYFAPDAELMPLLHTWSLAVEEQFYLLFPLLLLAGWRLGRERLAGLLGILGLLSLGLAELGWRFAPDANFYLLPGRAWELLAGAGCAFYPGFRPVAGRVSTAWLAGVGLVLLLGAVGLFDRGLPFPGLYALVPVAGTVLLILYARSDQGVGRVLASPILAGIGLISYSAYLWHQPLLVFTRMLWLDAGPGLLLVAVLLAFGLAWLSWRLVERPFRDRQRFSRRQVFGFALAGSLLLIVSGLILIGLDGVPRRFL
ncbi:MAG: acyltransferase [Thiothrix sp.]|nr:acyltransferase [Thiothrix sp.]HPE61742.1 acyltransferase [Thiolinea sp.]